MHDPSKPFQIRITKPVGNCTDATSVWLRAGRKLRVETTSRQHYPYAQPAMEPSYTIAKASHFHDGRWEEVLPWHAVPYIESEADTEAAHAKVADRIVELLAA